MKEEVKWNYVPPMKEEVMMNYVSPHEGGG
jgi:hypothetical protein